jgi:CheY-like chemotaxis protein
MKTPYATILVCDDEAHIRHIIGAKLRSSGLHVLEARNGREALSLLEQGPPTGVPSLVITDLQMPVMSGLEMCKVLRNREQTCAVPALMLTARGYVLTDEDLAATNIRQVISKPFGVRQLLDRVVSILSGVSPALVPPGLLVSNGVSQSPGTIAA